MNLKQLKKDMEDQKETVRTGVVKASIRGAYDGKNSLEFWKKKNGRIEIKWRSLVPIKSTEYVKCELGHKHEVENEETWIWDYAELTRDDVEKLIEFLT